MTTPPCSHRSPIASASCGRNSSGCGRTFSVCRKSTARGRSSARTLAALDQLLSGTAYATYHRATTLTVAGTLVREAQPGHAVSVSHFRDPDCARQPGAAAELSIRDRESARHDRTASRMGASAAPDDHRPRHRPAVDGHQSPFEVEAGVDRRRTEDQQLHLGDGVGVGGRQFRVGDEATRAGAAGAPHHRSVVRYRRARLAHRDCRRLQRQERRSVRHGHPGTGRRNREIRSTARA